MNSTIWKTVALTSALALVLAACGDQESASAPPETAEVPAQPSVATVQEAPRIEIPFEHVVLNQSGAFTGDATSAEDSALTAEFLSGTAEEVTESLTASLRAQGFRLSNSEPARGGVRHTFRRGEGEVLSVLVRPRGEVTLVTDGAAGSVFISWRPN